MFNKKQNKIFWHLTLTVILLCRCCVAPKLVLFYLEIESLQTKIKIKMGTVFPAVIS